MERKARIYKPSWIIFSVLFYLPKKDGVTKKMRIKNIHSHAPPRALTARMERGRFLWQRHSWTTPLNPHGDKRLPQQKIQITGKARGWQWRLLACINAFQITSAFQQHAGHKGCSADCLLLLPGRPDETTPNISVSAQNQALFVTSTNKEIKYNIHLKTFMSVFPFSANHKWIKGFRVCLQAFLIIYITK